VNENRTTQLTRNGNPQPIDPERHARKCSICQSENREAIDDAYLDWLSPDWISRMFEEIGSRMVVYRHAQATGLKEFRRRNLRSALDRILEQVQGANVSGDCALRAIKAYSHLNDDGQWTEPIQKVVISRRSIDITVPDDPQIPIKQRTILIDTPNRLELDATPTKQTPNLISNREKNDPPDGGLQ
jgi:hypothetical protein